jgi:hypothetical protein
MAIFQTLNREQVKDAHEWSRANPSDRLCKAVFSNGEWRLSHLAGHKFTHLVTIDCICTGDVISEAKRSRSMTQSWAYREEWFLEEMATRVRQ